MSLRIIINGASGKMGSLACKTIASTPGMELVAGLTSKDSLSEAIAQTRADVVVDLTRADAVFANSLAIIESGAHPVIGTSGLMADEIQHLTLLCHEKKLGGIIVPNFSLGAVLMMRFSAMAAAFMPSVEIIEYHHPAKYDAPSGTAIKTAEMIAAHRKTEATNIHCQEILPGARGANLQDIPIHSLRLPGVLARQEVIFGNTGETLSVVHDSIDRVSFMPGVVLCCQKVVELQSLLYGLESLLGV